MCVFSQIKDIKHIILDFYSVTCVMAQGWDLGVLGAQRFDFSKHGHVAHQIEGDDEKNRIQVKKKSP